MLIYSLTSDGEMSSSQVADILWVLSDVFNYEVPNIFAAIQERLGVILESAKGPVEVFVIDRVERPQAN